MEKLIPLINKIHEVTKNKNLDFSLNLPEIVVVGEQSAGKSSVLETLVGKPCLPRGTGTATLCPIRIELNKLDKPMKAKASADTDDKAKVLESYAVLSNGSEMETVTDFSKLPGMLRKKMDEMSPNRKIIEEEITVKIFSTKTPNLTLVDLPGRLLVPTGDQSIEDIDNLVKKYIQNPKSIILAITIAGQDHGSSLALEAARWTDPERERTLVVVTKLDQLLKGEEVTDLLEGRLLKVNLGIIGVINRSTGAEEGRDQTIEQKQVQEQEFLEERYREIAHHHGSKVLRSKIKNILVQEIQRSLPGLKAQIEKQRTGLDADLKKLGEPIPENQEKAAATVSLLLDEFRKRYTASVQGSGGDTSRPSRKTNIAVIMDANFRSGIDGAKQNLDDDEILRAIENTQSLESSITVCERAFQEIMRPQIRKLDRPAKTCANLVKEELFKMVKENQDAERFPVLQNEIENFMSTLLKSQHEKTLAEIDRYVVVLSSYIKTTDCSFNQFAAGKYACNMGEPVHRNKPNPNHKPNSYFRDACQGMAKTRRMHDGSKVDFNRDLSSTEELWQDSNALANEATQKTCRNLSGDRCNAIRTLVDKYSKITADQFFEYCAKIIYTCLIKEVADQMPVLYSKILTGKGGIENLLVEDQHIQNQRITLRSRIAALDEALKEINAVVSVKLHG